MLLTAIRKLVGSMLVMASDEEPAVQSKPCMKFPHPLFQCATCENVFAVVET